MTLCMCIICLNIRMLFDVILLKANADGDDISYSISKFFMNDIQCSMSPIGYYTWDCIMKKCKICKSNNPVNLKCAE